MEINIQNTKTLLVLSAGQLFAEHGFDGVSTRMIAEKAGVNLGGIHYHFGNKENLYVEAFRLACEDDDRRGIAGVLADNPELEKTPAGFAEAVYLFCRKDFANKFSPDKPHWQIRMMIRELSTPSSAMPILIQKIFKNDYEDAIKAYQKIKPGASDEEALIWKDFVSAQIVFYLMAKKPLELMLDSKELGEEFFNLLAKMTAKSMILMAGLPLPDKLKEI